MSYQIIRSMLPLLVAVALIGATCQGAYQAAIVTATTLDRQFATTGPLMDRLVREQKITWAEYEPWTRFAQRYKVLSSSAYTALKAATNAKTTQDATTIINGLEAEIAMYLIFAQGK